MPNIGIHTCIQSCTDLGLSCPETKECWCSPCNNVSDVIEVMPARWALDKRTINILWPWLDKRTINIPWPWLDKRITNIPWPWSCACNYDSDVVHDMPAGLVLDKDIVYLDKDIVYLDKDIVYLDKDIGNTPWLFPGALHAKMWQLRYIRHASAE